MSVRERLLKRRSGLLQDSAQAVSSYGMHMADGATEDFDRDFTLSQVSSGQDLLYEVEEALKRIQNDTYGRCELTGKPIPQKRLDALPWTRFTAEASAQLERQGALPRAHLGSLPPEHGAMIETEDEEKPAKEEELTATSLFPSDDPVKPKSAR